MYAEILRAFRNYKNVRHILENTSPSMEMTNNINALCAWVAAFGLPNKLLSDNDSQFTSSDFIL